MRRKALQSEPQELAQLPVANDIELTSNFTESIENIRLTATNRQSTNNKSSHILSNSIHQKSTYFYIFFLLLVTLISVTALSGNSTSINNDNKIYNISYHQEGTQAKNKSTQSFRLLQGSQANIASSTIWSKLYNLRVFSNLLDFLNHNNMQTIFQINCDIKCQYYFDNLVYFPKMLVDYWDGLTFIQYDTYKVYDWINCESFQFCIDLFLQNQFLMQTVKYGVSFRNDRIQEFNFDKIIKHFEDHGFYYDEIKSLNLVRPEDRMIMLFIRGKLEEEVLPFKKPTKNAIAIHLVLKMVENIDYLREWIGYHLNLGVDKFFFYDNSNSVKSEMVAYDYLVSAQTTKIGLNLACFNKTRQQVKKKWEELWLDFYDHIVYVPWQPKDSNGQIIYGQMKALEDYVFFFKHVAKFTAYTDPDEFIFSPDNLDLEEYLRKKESQGVTTLRIRSRHFPHRVCGPNKRVTDMVDYYPHTKETTFRLWAPKIICVTKKFKPWGSIHDGTTLQGLRTTPPENELRFNHYTFEYFNLIVSIDYSFSDTTKLLVDDSLPKRYGKVIDDICKSKCSENFAISCPPGKEFVYCIDADETLPLNKPDAQKLKQKLEQKRRQN